MQKELDCMVVNAAEPRRGPVRFRPVFCVVSSPGLGSVSCQVWAYVLCFVRSMKIEDNMLQKCRSIKRLKSTRPPPPHCSPTLYTKHSVNRRRAKYRMKKKMR